MKLFLASGAFGLWTLAIAQQIPVPPEIPPAVPDETLLDKALEPLRPDGNQVGRFQLFQGQSATMQDGKEIYRIDTVTGQVWNLSSGRWQNGTEKGLTLAGWLAISEKEVFWFGEAVQKQFLYQQRAKKLPANKR